MADYTKYNYDELVQRVTNKLKDEQGWGDAYTSSMGQTIIQTIAATVDQLHYMLERRSQETYLPTAQLNSSVRSIGNAHGYRPRRKVSSKGKVRIDLEDQQGDPTSTIGTIFIPRYTRVTWEGNEFLTNEEATIEPGESSVEVQIVEGSFEQYTEDPNDTTTDLYKYNFIVFSEYTSIEDTTLVVEEDGQKYFDVFEERQDKPAIESLSFADEGEKVYDLRIANDGLRVVFGSGLFGNKPTNPVTVSWVKSSGSDIEIRRTGIEFSFVTETLEDDIQKTPKNKYYYTMTNIENIDGGLDEESTDDIRVKSPEFIRTGNRAVTKDDYTFWGKRSSIGGIVDIFTYGEEELGVTAFNMNNVYMTYLIKDGSQLTTTEQNSLRTYMDDLKPITTHLIFKHAEVIPSKINMSLKRHPKLEISNSELYAYIRSQLMEFFEFREGSLAKNLYHSDVIDYFHNLTITKNNKEYDVARFVHADIQPIKEIEIPSVEPYQTDSSYSINVSVGNDGDEYILDLTYNDSNDELQSAEVSYTQQSGDSSSNIVSELQTQIDGLNGLTATANSSTLTIDVENAGDEYTVTNRQSTQPKNIPVDAVVTLPPRLLKNDSNIDLIKPGSIRIIEASSPYTELGTDDSAGSITIDGNSGSIDYTNGEMVIPLYEAGKYVIEYEQDNDEKNIFANPKTVISYSPAKEFYTDSTEKLSTIEIIT